jgi:TonB family protein
MFKNKSKAEKTANWLGAALTLIFHAALFAFVGLSSLKYIYPPPEEKALLIDFEQVEIEKPKRTPKGAAPRSVKPNPKEEVKIVKAAKAQEIGRKQNLTQESTLTDKGDVEKYEPPRKKINRKSLAVSADNPQQKDSLAPQTAFERSDQLEIGHAQGNSKVGQSSGEPNARLEGRNVLGYLPKPKYEKMEEGIVVVRIWVNQSGKVEKAMAGAKGTTITDASIWAAARTAAMKTNFSTSAHAPALQEGTITYIFKLK